MRSARHSGTPRARLFFLVMTARANEVEPFEYLSYLFEHLPRATTVEGIEALLPWTVRTALEERRKRQDFEQSRSSDG